MPEYKYTSDHEWVYLDENGLVVVGITDFAQKELGDIVYIELPELDKEFAQHDEVAVIESVKAASEIKIPISGVIREVNTGLTDTPETVNSDPLGDGWMLKLSPSVKEQLDALMDEAAYTALITDKT